MCDWIVSHMPRLTAWIGNMSLAGQLVLAFASLFALFFGYCLVKRCAEVLPCRDEEEFDPTWMDAELYEAGEI